jgi:hypothetical protein
VIYSRTAGDSPMVIVTIQEMPQTGTTEAASGNRKN